MNKYGDEEIEKVRLTKKMLKKQLKEEIQIKNYVDFSGNNNFILLILAALVLLAYLFKATAFFFIIIGIFFVITMFYLCVFWFYQFRMVKNRRKTKYFITEKRMISKEETNGEYAYLVRRRLALSKHTETGDVYYFYFENGSQWKFCGKLYMYCDYHSMTSDSLYISSEEGDKFYVVKDSEDGEILYCFPCKFFCLEEGIPLEDDEAALENGENEKREKDKNQL